MILVVHVVMMLTVALGLVVLVVRRDWSVLIMVPVVLLVLFRELLVPRYPDGKLTWLLVMGLWLRLTRQWTWRNLTHSHDRWILEFTRRLGRPVTMCLLHTVLMSGGGCCSHHGLMLKDRMLWKSTWMSMRGVMASG
jgi:hypothetical protein